jgi:hypothetical protein
MSERTRRSRSEKKAAYTVRPDQRSDPKPTLAVVKKLRRLPPPKNAPNPHAGASRRGARLMLSNSDIR